MVSCQVVIPGNSMDLTKALFFSYGFLFNKISDTHTQTHTHTHSTFSDLLYAAVNTFRSQIELRYGQDMCKLANSVMGRGEVGYVH